MNRWFAIRLVIIAVAASCTGSSVAPLGNDWRVCGIFFAVVMVGTFCGIGGAYQTEGVSTGWNKPSWYQNPFSFRSQPLQFVHLVAFCVIAEGIGGELRGLWTGSYVGTPGPGVSIAIGLGFWIALRLAVMIFHPKSSLSMTENR